MKRVLLLLISLTLAVTMLVSCSSSPAVPAVHAQIEPTVHDTPELAEQETQEPAEQAASEPTDIPTETVGIQHISYFGDRTRFHLSAEHALAYAEAIKTAYIDLSEHWGYFTFDTLYPVLLDVSGDGVPLLLLAERDDAISWGPAYWNILFGFTDGALQRITDFPTGIGIATIEDERLLALVGWSDFGGRISLYRIQNGAAELVSSTRFFDDWHNGAFYIDDIEVSEDKFWTTIENLSIEHLMDTSHPGTVHSLPAFKEYLSQSFTRDKAVQIFLDYADAAGDR